MGKRRHFQLPASLLPEYLLRWGLLLAPGEGRTHPQPPGHRLTGCGEDVRAGLGASHPNGTEPATPPASPN